jgi:hypothetical protein
MFLEFVMADCSSSLATEQIFWRLLPALTFKGAKRLSREKANTANEDTVEMHACLVRRIGNADLVA